MAVDFCGLKLAHPIVNGSGTFDAIAAQRAFGDALLADFPFSAFVSKTITLAPRAGNPPPRLWETAGGMINSIGLPNRGLDGYLEHDLPQLARLPVPLITNVMGSTATEVARLVEAVDARPEVAAIELNVSCPNVATGLDIGADPVSLGALVRAVRPLTGKPLIVKLTPNTADVAAVAQAAEAAGADAVSLINTLRAMALQQVGFPLLVRPSYVLGGRAMEIVYSRGGPRRLPAPHRAAPPAQAARGRSSSTASWRTRSRSTSTRSATASRSGSAASCSTSRRPGSTPATAPACCRRTRSARRCSTRSASTRAASRSA